MTELPPFKLHRLQRLASALMDGNLPNEQQNELSQLLHNNDQAQTYYVDLMAVHAQLHWRHDSQPQDLPGNLEPAASQHPLHPPIAKALARIPDAIHWQSHPIIFTLLSSILTLLSVGAFLAVMWPQTWVQDSAQDPGIAQHHAPKISHEAKVPDFSKHWNVVAQVTGLHKVHWDDGKKTLPVASQLEMGQSLHITSGFLEVTFADGGFVVLEGPATFRADSRNACTLTNGKLVASVPPWAIGFTVHTLTSDFIDLGTEFGVQVEPDKHALAHVFKGRIQAKPKSKGSQSVVLGEGDSITVSSEGVVRGKSDSLSKHFTRQLPDQFLQSQEILAYDISTTQTNSQNFHPQGVGLFFQTSQNVNVTQLGTFLTVPEISTSDKITVQLWDATTAQEQVLQTVVWQKDSQGTATGSQRKSYRYLQPLKEPIVLEADRKYAVVLYGTEKSFPYLNINSQSEWGAVLRSHRVLQHLDSRYVDGIGGPGVLPAKLDSGFQNGILYGGPTFVYQTLLNKEPKQPITHEQ